MEFDPHFYPFPSRRPVLYGRAMTASSNPLTSQLGLDILQSGGNAVDAAVAMAAAMPVLEPTCNGLGSDLFVLIYSHGKIYGLNASGFAGKEAHWEKYRDLGYEKMPLFGPLSVNLGGAVHGWANLSQTFGKLPFQEVLAPAISYAKGGYPVSETISKLWEMEFSKYQGLNGDYGDLFTLYGKGKRPPKAGEMYKNPALGKSLELIAQSQGEAFYRGELARASASFLKDQGSFLTFEDFQAYRSSWVDPISTNYRGYTLHEMPPNGHGISVLMALAALNQLPFQEGPDFVHQQIEATKLAMTLASYYVCDPRFLPRSCQDLLSPHHIEDLRRRISNEAQNFPTPTSSPSTVYLTTADEEGTMVSLIQSNYDGFGSGLVHPDLSITYNNRAGNFNLDPNHPNCIGPRKQPYHTIIPGFITKEGRAFASFGVMGAFMQPQGHIQVVSNLLDRLLNPQAALDYPRWQWIGEKNLEVEEDFPEDLFQDLKSRGHQIKRAKDFYSMGRGQIILQLDNGIYCGGTEKRTDGHICVY